jgi:GT2 family glycosyltransferase
MVAKLLNRCGLYLGHDQDLMPPRPDNPDGFWENLKFVDLNEEILTLFRGGWDCPPTVAIDDDLAQMGTFRKKGESLVRQFEGREPWGWKDPRNSLTLPFWLDTVPALKVVICVRNPLEVALSLNKRNGLSYNFCLNLWEDYNRRLLVAVPAEQYIVTHYDAYFGKGMVELERVLRFLGISTDPETLHLCRQVTRTPLRHSRLNMRDLAGASVKAGIQRLYSKLCQEANWHDESGIDSLLRETDAAWLEEAKNQSKKETPMTAGNAESSRSGLNRAVLDAEALRRELTERTAWAKRVEAELVEREAGLRESQVRCQILKKERDGYVQELLAIRREKDVAERIDALERTLEAVLRGDTDAAKQIDYRRLVRRIRDVVVQTVPAGAIVLAVTKGDDELRRVEERPVWHFPQNQEGNYAGFPPADSGSAVVQLEALRRKGAQYLMLPSTAYWWLDHYAGLKSHLERRYRLLLRREDSCLIYSLCESPINEARSGGGLASVIAEYVKRFDCEPAILDWSTGLNLDQVCRAQAVFSPPSETGDVLPYLDHTVDIVALAHSNPARAAEASRVARVAVVTWAPDSVDVTSAAPQVEWLLGPDAPPLFTTSIIIPSYNGSTLTEACLAALAETLPADFRGEILVVDDCSTDDTQTRALCWAAKEPRLKVLRNAQNCGFLVTCNNGVAAASGDIIILLNNDTLPQHGWLEPLLRIFRDRPDAGAVGGKLVYPDGRLQEAGGLVFSDGSAANFGKGDYELDAPLYNYVREVDYVTGALIATPRALFNQLGGLDTRYRPIYYEETDYCFRLRENGYKAYYQPESVVIHLEGVTCGTDPGSGQKRHQVVNREKFRERWREALRKQPAPPGKFGLTTWYALAARGDCEERNE